MELLPLVSVIIPVYNQTRLLHRCLVSLESQQGSRIEIIVVDDKSPEDPGPVMAEHPQARFVRLDCNVGYAEANNRGLALAQGDYLMFLNSDTELPRGAVSAMVRYLESHPQAGAVAPLHRDPNGGVQRTCSSSPTLMVGFLWGSLIHRLRPMHPVLARHQLEGWDHLSERWVEQAITSCLLFRSEIHNVIGGMDARLRLFYNDTDYCYRLGRAGFKIRFLPTVEILHHGSASIATFAKTDAQVYADRCRYFRKWFGWRGYLALQCALWSRVAYESAVELAHGQLRIAAGKLRRGFQLSRGLGEMP